ncbi:sulfite exporter TauE/SafE family protein [Planktothrix mougeotii]|uniref:Probable membrane transporter protein n=1 Tax=Planktothrix mougeotii LEGE 06226 TaxID=1828728 RepID=A0ABR9U737_9CYAN|nr:sulfite exporter TauE/SafE family protein [Planktothrix mougeotii]MBE9141934.1 sulfite exporter TauE/SafE family protein [Planktothrix mougeotii LEGE 06226]
MTSFELMILATAGLVAGILAGFLGIGGGTVLVPLLVALGYTPVQAVATSSLSIVITAISGSVQNWRMGYLSFNRVIGIGFPAILTAQIGVFLAELVSSRLLLFLFGCLLLLNVYLVEVRQQITAQKKQKEEQQVSDSAISSHQNILFNPVFARILTGGTAGILAGLFGVGGGIIMVPLQIVLLGETIKVAIQTSLGVIVITAISACAGHAIQGNVLWIQGIILGLGGLLGAQISTRFLPKLSDKTVSLMFRIFLVILSVYIFRQATMQP